MNDLKQYRLKEVLSYDPESGDFRWLDKSNYRKECNDGDLVRVTLKGRYYLAFIDGHCYLAHRLAWLYVYGYMPKGQIDHINNDGLDNRILNLRDVSHGENQQNRKKSSKGSTSKNLGVSWNSTKNRWVSQIKTNGKVMHIGYFDTEDLAYLAYLEAKRKLHSTCTL